VVVLTAGGALLALRAYNGTRKSDPQKLERVLFSVRQQAGVMAAICTAVFGVISSLQSAKMGGIFSSSGGPSWGKRARIVDLVDEAA